jgi:peptidoglycan/LPS O-acetylase OafA/YrhL
VPRNSFEGEIRTSVKAPTFSVQRRQTFHQMGRIPALDGIRGLAISLVLWFHIYDPLRNNLPNHYFLGRIADLGRFTWSGVDLFFVLSGFLIGGILLDAVDSPTYFRTFYTRRAYRILPLYAAILGLTFAIDLCFQRQHLAQFLYYPVFLQNIQMAATASFGAVHVGVTWSLAVEEQFYLTMPWVVRRLSRHRLVILLLAVIVAAALLRATLLSVFPDNWVAAHVLTFCRSDALSIGVLVALGVREPGVLSLMRRYSWVAYTLLAILLLISLRVMWGHFEPLAGKAFGIDYSFLAIFYGLLLLSTLLSNRLSAIFSFGPLRFMGSIAYGVYLLHRLINFSLYKAFFYLRPKSGSIGDILVATASVAVSIAVATASWRYFEQPLVRRGHRYTYVDATSRDELPTPATANVVQDQ